MVSVDASWVIVASCPRPPPMPRPPPAAALASGTTVHFPAKLGGACARVIAVASATATAVSARFIGLLLLRTSIIDVHLPDRRDHVGPARWGTSRAVKTPTVSIRTT